MAKPKFTLKKRESNFDDYDGHTRKTAGKGKSTRYLNNHVLEDSYREHFKLDDYQFDEDSIYTN